MQATDGVMTYHDLRIVWPYGSIRLDSLAFVHQTGTHATLRLTGIVPEEKEEEIINHAGSHDWIELYRQTGKEKKPIFMGRLQHVEIKVVRAIHYVTIQAVSHTYAMDLSPKTRTFQQVDRLYRDVVDEILSVYPGGDVIDQMFENRQQGKFIMQYEETDWAFVRRIASHVGAVLVPDLSAHKVRFWIGMPEGRKQIKLEDAPYEVNRAIAPYMKKSANGSSSVAEYQYTTYTFEHDELLHIGDEVQRDGRTFVITKVTGTLEQGLLRWTYVCAVPESVKQTKLYNRAIIGAAIDGKIIQVGRNQVKIHLNMDKKQEASKAQWFPYAAEGNQILYLMPEIGSKVKLYFPSAEEDDGMVMNSVRHAPQGEAAHKQAQKMKDPGVKSFGIPQGKEFTLGDKELIMTAQEGMLYISMNKEAGVSLNSASQVSIRGKGAVSLSGAAVHLSGAEGLYVKTATDALELVEEANASSEKIQLEASARHSFPQILSAFEQDVQANGVAMVMARRTMENQWAEVQGKFAALGDTLAGLWSVAVDAGDLVVTGVLGGEDAQALYEFVSGSEVGSLTERNNLAKGAVEGVTSTVAYAEKVVTGQKAFADIVEDAGGAAASIGEGLYNDYIDPFVKDGQYRQENLHGGLWTRSVEESYAKGQNEFKKDMVLLEAGLTAVSGGAGTVALKTGKVAAKLDVDVDTPNGPKKQPHGEGDADGGKGKGGPLHGSAAQDMLGGIPLKDGKFKTKAKLLDDVLKDLNETIAKFLEKMGEQLNGKLVVMENAVTGQRYLAWQKGEGYSYSKDRAGEGGSHGTGVPAGHGGKTSGKDTSHRKPVPKAANGQDGYSNNQSSGNEKRGTEGTVKDTTESLYKRGSFRKGARAKAESEAPKNASGKMICPTCGKDIPDSITINTKNGPVKRIGYDLDHYPDTWAERVASMKAGEVPPTRTEVLDEYNARLRVQCHECNISHKYEGVEGTYKGVNKDD
ncbi:GH-E family nuclease [Brevibacillus agri]|uniref:GH-E family nuclease n=1 Tax=Brevibacillus agri TaxID=51101 RepID=UPI003D74D5C7